MSLLAQEEDDADSFVSVVKSLLIGKRREAELMLKTFPVVVVSGWEPPFGARKATYHRPWF